MAILCQNPQCGFEVPDEFERKYLEWKLDCKCPQCGAIVPLSSSGVNSHVFQSLKEWARADRITSAMVFTDIVGSTELVKRIGDEAMRNLIKAHLATARELINIHRGAFSNDTGDGVLAAFHDIGEALDFTVALRSNPGDTRVRIRGSIHVGPAEIDGTRLIGKEVHFASRVLKAIGKKSEIWLSDRAKEDLDCLQAARHRHLEWKSQRRRLSDFGQSTLWTMIECSIATTSCASPTSVTRIRKKR